MNKINDKIIILISGNYFGKKSIAYKLLDNCSDFRIITTSDINRVMEKQPALDRYNIIEKIIDGQQRRGIPSIIYCNRSLKNVSRNEKNIIHININEDDSKCEINIPEYNIEVVSNNENPNQTAEDLFNNVTEKLTKLLFALSNEQDIKLF